MNLVFKNNNETADENAPVIYADAVVNDGTLFAVDFSNRGMLNNYDLSRGVSDLAEGTPVRDNISMLPEVGFNDTYMDELPPLTEDKGFPTISLGGGSQMYTTGLMIQGVGQYLYENQPHCLFITWVKMDTSAENTAAARFIRLAQTGGNGFALSVYFNNPSQPIVNAVMGGKTGTGNLTLVNGEYNQIAIEFRSGTQGNRYFLNGAFVGTSDVTAGSFGEPVGDDILALGGIPAQGTNSPGVVYHMSLHDLDVSGLTPQSIVQRNYKYVNGIGQYSELPTRRPYANLPA